ncbi:MAG: aminotransferase class V-fold PLP-dependent enzyme [Gemmatimonadaceae bacterium]
MTRSPLDLDEVTMQRLGYRVTDIIAHHLANIRNEPVINPLPRSELSRLLAKPAPRQGTDFEAIVDILRNDVLPYHAREPHPRFLAYVPSCPTFPALLGDWLATGYNFFAGVWQIAPGPNEIELVVLEWFREWMGMPAGATGLLTSGGSGANLTAIVAARHAALERGAELSSLVMYTSVQAHSSVVRAAWIAGIPRRNIRVIGVDEEFRIIPQDLANAVADDRRAALEPFLVVASAGTTSTGSVDPVHEIANLCERNKLWLHIDAAYAGFAALTVEGKSLLDGIGRADSLTLDPHKWLFVPFECGCLMVKDASTLESAFRILPDYLKDGEAGEHNVNFADRGEQLTRYSRALKIWLSVTYFGTDAIAAAIQAAMDRARLAQTLIESSPKLELLSTAKFGIVCFRAQPASPVDAHELDAFNERINSRIVAGGSFFISSTRLDGIFSLRMCTLGFRTTDDDIRALFDAVELAVDAEQT